MTAAVTDETAAWVAGVPLVVAEVEERLARVRAAGFGARLPQPHTAEGRNARRWVVQLLCAERVVDAELAAHGIARSGAQAELAVERALALGGVAAAVWAVRPEISELVAGWDIQLAESDVRAYFERNRDLFGQQEYREVRDRIAQELHSSAADRAFAAWLDRAIARDVVLAHGYEHPADPGHPDATHHH